MKKTLQISAAFDKPDFLEDLVEKLAQRRNDFGVEKVKIPRGLKLLDSSSLEAYVNGDITLSETGTKKDGELIKMPFISCFFFTCTREKNKEFDLTWALSLS